MSWFFGKKKHHRESPNSPEETAQSDEGFVVVKMNQPETDSETNEKPQNLYPALNNIIPYPPMPISNVKQNSQDSNANDLSNIPFKLCAELEKSMNEDSVIDQLRLNEIASFFKKVNTADYDYQFTLEQSIIDEMNSQT